MIIPPLSLREFHRSRALGRQRFLCLCVLLLIAGIVVCLPS